MTTFIYIFHMAEKTFSDFLREEEKKHPFLSSLKDELGINASDLEHEPQVASFFSLGGKVSNISPYKILKFKRDHNGRITHALVRQTNDPSMSNRHYKDDGEGGFVKIDEKPKERTFLVPIGDLDKLMSQDFQPQGGGI
jgi:hypothetical protein